MLLQGQDFIEDRYFDAGDPLDWDRAERFSGMTCLYRDLISLRLNRDGVTRGLTGQHVNVHHVNDGDKVIAFHRWSDGGTGNDVIVLVNFANQSWDHYEIGFPQQGNWRLRFNSDWAGYSKEFADLPASDVNVEPTQRDGLPASGAVSIGPYAILVLSQETDSPQDRVNVGRDIDANLAAYCSKVEVDFEIDHSKVIEEKRQQTSVPSL